MGRPPKRFVDYFPHDSHASDGKTLTILEQRFGAEGYRFWFKLLERLSSTPNHVIDCRNDTDWAFLTAKCGVTVEKGNDILKTLIDVEALDRELGQHRMIWSQNLVDRLSYVYDNRRSVPPLKPALPVSTVNNAISTVNKPVSNRQLTELTELKETPLPPVETPLPDGPGNALQPITKRYSNALEEKRREEKRKEYIPLTPLPPRQPLDERFQSLIQLREHCTGRVGTGQDSDHIKDFLLRHTEEEIASAIRKAGEAKALSWKYVETCLEGGNDGRKTDAPKEHAQAAQRVNPIWEPTEL